MKAASPVHADIATDLRTRWPYGVELLRGGQLAPAADYLDHDGIDYIRAHYTRPTTKHYAKHCPAIYRVASAIFNGLAEEIPHPDDLASALFRGPSIWATNQLPNKQKGIKIWHTYTSGCKRTGKGKTWYEKGLTLIDIINALTDPKRYSIGAKSSPGQPIHQLRIDVDMDSAWGQFGDIDDIRRELALEHALLTDMGYHPHYFRTGNRGHQIIIPIDTTRNHDRARQAINIICQHLEAAPRDWRAKIDCNSLDSIMRLPLGRHALTSQVAWMIDPATAEHLPMDQQVAAVESAFTKWSNDSLDLAFESDSSCCNTDAETYNTDCVVTSQPVEDVKDRDIYTVTVSNPAHYHVGIGWARKVIDEGFEPGGFREWAYAGQGRKNGIGAAILLYGTEVPNATPKERLAHIVERTIEYVCAVPESKPGLHANRASIVRYLVPRNNIDAYFNNAAKLHKDLGGVVIDEDERFGQALRRMLVEAQQANRDIKPRVFTSAALRTLEHIGALVHMLFRELKEKNIYCDS